MVIIGIIAGPVAFESTSALLLYRVLQLVVDIIEEVLEQGD